MKRRGCAAKNKRTGRKHHMFRGKCMTYKERQQAKKKD